MLIVYYPDTGIIQQIVGDPSSSIVADAHRKDGMGVVEIDYKNSLVIDGRFVTKPTMSVGVSKTQIIADGKDSIIITNVPDHAAYHVLHDGALVSEGICMDGEIEISGTVSGNYDIAIHSPKFLDFSATIKAVAP